MERDVCVYYKQTEIEEKKEGYGDYKKREMEMKKDDCVCDEEMEMKKDGYGYYAYMDSKENHEERWLWIFMDESVCRIRLRLGLGDEAEAWLGRLCLLSIDFSVTEVWFLLRLDEPEERR